MIDQASMTAGFTRTETLGYALLGCVLAGVAGGLIYALVRPRATYRPAPISRTRTVWQGRPVVSGAEVWDERPVR